MDDTAAQFSQGTQSATVVRADTGGDGAVELARKLEEPFDDPTPPATLPAGWTSNPWPSAGAATVAGGSLLVDGARADSGVPAGPGSSLEFTATFGTEEYRHVGFATDFDTGPWAIFSTGPVGTLPVGLYARTSTGGTTPTVSDQLLTAGLASGMHTYRIDWTTTGFDYFVDGAPLPVATHAIPIPQTAGLRAQASDYKAGSGGVSIDSMFMEHKPSGVFTSRTLDAGDTRVTGLSFTATSALPTGTAIAYETRTAAAAADVAAAPWAPLGAGGAVTSPPARYLQYRATLSTTVPRATPRLDKVEVGFTIDDQAPTVTINDLTVTRATAKLKFSSDDAAAVLKCKLDTAPFADCSSPAEYSGLAAGSHTIVVQATDPRGNVGSATRTYDVDTHAPAVTISDVAVFGTTAKVTFGSDDAAAVVQCKLDGAEFAACASPAEYTGLAAGSHAVVVQATDAQGNVGSATRAFSVASPGGPGTTPPPPGGGARDVTAPTVRLTPHVVRVRKDGTVKIGVKCPVAEVRCTVTVTLKLKLGGKRLARKTLTVPGGKTRTLRLQLSRGMRLRLAARSTLKVTAAVTARDAAGNSRTTQVPMTLRAAAG